MRVCSSIRFSFVPHASLVLTSLTTSLITSLLTSLRSFSSSAMFVSDARVRTLYVASQFIWTALWSIGIVKTSFLGAGLTAVVGCDSIRDGDWGMCVPEDSPSWEGVATLKPHECQVTTCDVFSFLPHALEQWFLAFSIVSTVFNTSQFSHPLPDFLK